MRRSSLSEVIIKLLGRMFIPAKLDKIKLKAGEKVLMVTHETKWKNVYKKTVLAFFKAFLPSLAVVVALDAMLVAFLFVTNIKQIVDGKFGLPVPLLIVVGLAGFLIIEIPSIVYRYHMEELGRQLLKIVVTNQQTIVWAVVVPFGYCVSSQTPLTEIKDVTSGPDGFKASDVGKLESKVSFFDQLWAGLAYRRVQVRTVNLPSQLREASDSIVLDNAAGGFMDVLAALVAEAKVFDEKKRTGKEMQARSEIQQHLADLGVTVESHATIADPIELAAALQQILNPEGLTDRYIDAMTLQDPGFCDLKTGTVDINAIRGVKAKAAAPSTAPGVGFKRVPRPGATV
ncbi:MAG: hypothetical protein AAB486_03300 [Patescibacteria group bacterium]